MGKSMQGMTGDCLRETLEVKVFFKVSITKEAWRPWRRAAKNYHHVLDPGGVAVKTSLALIFRLVHQPIMIGHSLSLSQADVRLNRAKNSARFSKASGNSRSFFWDANPLQTLFFVFWM